MQEMQKAKVWFLGGEDPLEKEMQSQYSCLENSMNRGAWWAMVHGGHEELDMTQHTHTHIGNTYRLSNRKGPSNKEMDHIENKPSQKSES